MAEKSTRLLLSAEEIAGDLQGTVDFVFCRIGEPVPLKPTHFDSAFDLSNPPFQPLAISERHRLLFLAHNEGFLVANIKDVIGLAKGAKGKDACVQRSSVLDAQIGRVSILALSGDNSMLAATVGEEIQLFYVQSLLDKVQEPAISCSLSESGIVKDLKWQRSSENSFIVLSSHGLLCHGSSDIQLKDVTDNVDAVDWSVDGNFVAIARKDTVSILSSNFNEILGIPLLFQSWAVDSGSEIKVDTIKWVRHDSIVIGCTQLKEDGDEDGYLVQVIASGEHKFTEVSCKPVVFSFPDLFEGLSVDMLPTGAGPYLLTDYLDCWDVAITSNKKNIDQHISLLRWLVEDNRYEVVSLELGSDKYIPRIDLQDDGDDNLILGLAVDKSSLYENIKIQSDMEFKELSPRCILLCLTCDGKLILNHAAWVSEPSDLPKMVSSHGDNIVNEGFHTISSDEIELEVTTSRLKDELDAAISNKMHLIPGGKIGSHGTLDGTEPCSEGPSMIKSRYSRRPAIEEPSIYFNAVDLGTESTDYEISSDSLMVKGTGTDKIVGSAVTARSTFGSRAAQKIFGVDGSNASSPSTVQGTGAGRSIGSTINEGSSSLSPTVIPFAVDGADAKHFLSSPGESNLAGIGNKILFSPSSNSPANLASFSKSFGTLASSEIINQSSVQTSSSKSGYTGSASILHSSSVAASTKLPGSQQQLFFANSTSSKPRPRLESEPQFSKQFYNVKDVAKELDGLLSAIECEGGFKDLCTVFQEKSLLALEAGLDNLSEVLFAYRDKIENQRMDIQQLWNKMLEVSARQVYMKGIVQQASDRRYWAFWNSQKLSPKFEAKRLHISNLKQNLTNQLIDLGRHFNSLEINKFGEYNTITAGRRAPSSFATSRTQSLHSLYSTVNSQLATAEQLSERLSKQMAVLNITSPTSEKRNVTKELFKSIGLDPKTDAFMSPDLKTHKLSPYSSKRTSPSSATALKEQPWNCAPNSEKAFELEPVRRKRDSLDKSWAHFQPSKIIVKRTSKKEQVRSTKDIAFREAKEVFDSQVKAFDSAQKDGMSNSRASSKALDFQTQAFDITKRPISETASFLSKKTFSNSQSREQSPSKGIQEKAMDVQSKPISKWAKDPSDLRSEPNASFTSTSSQVPQSAATQPSSFAAPSIFSNSNSNKDDKFGSPFMSNIGASSSTTNNSATKTALISKSTSGSTPSKFSSTVSPLKTSTSLKNEVDTLPSSANPSTKNSTVASSTFSTSIAQATVSSTSSSPSSFQFGNSMPSNFFVSPIKPNDSSLFSNELSSKSTTFPAMVHASEDSLFLNKIGSKLEPATPQSTNNAAVDDAPKELSSLHSSKLTTETSQASVGDKFSPKKEVSLHSDNVGTVNTNNSKLFFPPSTTNGSTFPAASGFLPEVESSIMTTEKDENLDVSFSLEDEMEEEALDTNSMLNLESLVGFSLQSTPSSNSPKPNPFGSSFFPASTGSASPQLSWSVSPGQLFRPSSFSLPESQSKSTGGSSLTGSISGGFSGFGQPAQLGAGQQALGSVLGSFGQSRQLGTGSTGFGFGSAAGSSGGFSNAGGFAGVATGGGFTGASSNVGGFAGAGAGGGFAGVASFSGGFAAAAGGGGGGFGGTGSGGGFATGGFGGFSSFQGSGFSGFGSGNSSASRPPADLLTQMRK